jgi:hypothetical protein
MTPLTVAADSIILLANNVGCEVYAKFNGVDLHAKVGDLIERVIEEYDITKRNSGEIEQKKNVELKDYEALSKKYKDLVAWADKQAGVPCEQIRHQHEIDELKEKISKYQDNQHHFYQKLLKAGYGELYCNDLDQLVELICQGSNWGERSVKKLLEENAVLLEVYKNAHALALGEDWNNGTQAKFHRDPLIKAIVVAKNVITKVEKINDSN